MDPLFQLLLKHGGGGDAITTGAFIDIDSRESGMDPTAGDRKAVRLKPSPCKHLLTAKALHRRIFPDSVPADSTDNSFPTSCLHRYWAGMY
jgi:hypothetical protein